MEVSRKMAVKENQHLADGSAVLLMSLLLLFHVKQLSSNQKKEKKMKRTKEKKIISLAYPKN